MEVLDDTEGPEALAVATLARRIAAIDWFAPRRDDCPPSRIAAVFAGFVGAFSLPGPESLVILPGPAGREALASGRFDDTPMPWRGPLVLAATRVGEVLRQATTVPRRPLLDRTGDAVLVNLAALPIPRFSLMRRLAGPDPRRSLRSPVVTALADRIAWELGAMLAWALAGPALPANPFLTLLALYEEGVVVLDLTKERATLWLPGEG